MRFTLGTRTVKFSPLRLLLNFF